MKKEKSAGAIIFRRSGKNKKYLLLHYESGHWDFPRGHIERGEKELETAVREIREETGIVDPAFVPGFRIPVSWFFRKKIGKKSVRVFKTAILYLAETRTRRVKISNEHVGHKWLPFEKAVELITFDNSKALLKKAEEFLRRQKARGRSA